VCEIEEERLFLISLDEVDRLLRKSLGQEVRIWVLFYHLVLLDQGEWREVIMLLIRMVGMNVMAVWDTKKLIEPLVDR